MVDETQKGTELAQASIDDTMPNARMPDFGAAAATAMPIPPGLVMLDERNADLNLLPPQPKERSTGAIITIVAVLLLIGAGVGVIATSEWMREDLKCFLDGRLTECKTADKLALEKKWKLEDLRARPHYGDIALTYYPGDARLKVTQRVFEQKGLDGAPGEPTEKEIENDTGKLKPGQTIERLPITNLPVYETTKASDGSVDKAYTYEYILTFTKDGYYPRTFVIYSPQAAATGKVVEGAQALLWQSIGPGNEIIQWPGLDLVPTPETIKANMVKVVTSIFCSLKWSMTKPDSPPPKAADLPKADLEMVQGFSALRRDSIFKRNGFRGVDDFVAAWETYTTGTHLEWWTAQQTAILASTCEGMEPPSEPEKKGK